MCIRVSFPRCPDREHHPRLPRLQFKKQTRHNPARKPRVFSRRAGYAGVGLKTEKMWSHVTRFALPHPLRLLAKKKKKSGDPGREVPPHCPPARAAASGLRGRLWECCSRSLPASFSGDKVPHTPLCFFLLFLTGCCGS